MGFNPFASVGDYPGSLNKIATYTLGASALSIWLLRNEFKVVDDLLAPLTLQIPMAVGIALPLGTVLPAFFFAVLSRVVKLHDRLSDILFIRQRFDVGAILLPLAVGSGADLRVDAIRRIKQQRESLMYKTFYKYASSSPDKAVIDTHYVTMALDQWCWYWIILEASFLGLCLGLIFLLTEKYFLASVFFLALICAVGFLQIIRSHCANYALQELEQILAEPRRKEEIAKVFRAL
jgi:hypothetical protein